VGRASIGGGNEVVGIIGASVEAVTEEMGHSDIWTEE